MFFTKRNLKFRGLNGVTAIEAGDAHTVALESDRAVVAWGATTKDQTS